MSLKIKTTPEIASKLKDAKTFDARLFQPPHSQADKREMQKLLSDLQNGNRAVILAHSGASGHLNRSIRPPLFSGCEA